MISKFKFYDKDRMYVKFRTDHGTHTPGWCSWPKKVLRNDVGALRRKYGKWHCAAWYFRDEEKNLRWPQFTDKRWYKLLRAANQYIPRSSVSVR